jgi:voltage-gated potassium channel
LLSSLLLLALIVPLFQGTRLGSLAMDTVSTAIVASGVWAASRQLRDLLMMSALALAMTARWFPFVNEKEAIVFSSIAGVVFFAYVAAIILRDLMAATKVTLDTIGGAFCGYVVIGIAWGSLYFVIELLNQGSFKLTQTGEPTYAKLQADFLRLVYYSFATLTTTGYGDISARSVLARNLSMIEAMVGQFYIAVLVARLVSLQITQHRFGD